MRITKKDSKLVNSVLSVSLDAETGEIEQDFIEKVQEYSISKHYMAKGWTIEHIVVCYNDALVDAQMTLTKLAAATGRSRQYLAKARKKQGYADAVEAFFFTLNNPNYLLALQKQLKKAIRDEDTSAARFAFGVRSDYKKMQALDMLQTGENRQASENRSIIDGCTTTYSGTNTKESDSLPPIIDL